MKVIESVKEMRAWSEEAKRKGKRLGFVPTMGYLHEGHLSLVRASKSQNDLTVVSVYLNPLQFGENEDLKAYPRDFERDQALCREEGVEIVFHPSRKEMLAGPSVEIELGGLAEKLCGKSRPTHFQGVAKVCAKLFDIVKPDQAFFGLKDYQQCLVVKKMVEDLNLGLEIVACPLVREEDGLALSSRNQYLSEAERREAVSLFQGLKAAQEMFRKGEAEAGKLVQAVRERLEKTSGRIDYIKLVDPETLEEVSQARKGDVLLSAVYFGQARLIDNLVMA